jgi:aldehyde dehydrogenase (NAD+)
MAEYQQHLQHLKSYFESGATRSYSFRREQLQKLRHALLKYEKELYNALQSDLKKNIEESWITEIGFVINEINYSLDHLREWMKPERVSTNLLNFPSKSLVLKEPLGVVLLIGPWNYPLQLLFTPLVGAIAAGNCIVLKPSEYAPATSRVMDKIVSENFSPEYILCIQGDGGLVVPALMNQFRFNHIFFTGSTSIGKKIYQAAAEQLVPVTLELGGKSPCVIESDANLKVAARRIVVTKFSNAGQMCVAPDYLLVQRSVKADFEWLLKKYITEFFSSDASTNYNYGKIINEKQFDRLVLWMKEGEVIHGGRSQRETLYIEPTLVEIPGIKSGPENTLLREEIFGPILPILAFDTFEDAKTIIDRNPDPLAFYVFTSDHHKEKKWLESVPFGGGCVNNASWHLTNPHLPFGGRGNSGIGNYHGRNSFEVFSHRKAVMKTPTWFDPAIKYPPFRGRLSLFKKIVG